jgi:hypothetical protein
MVQPNVLVPTVIPVMAEFGDVGLITLAVPTITVHAPVPTDGILPFNAEDEEQIVESNPALAVVGNGST